MCYILKLKAPELPFQWTWKTHVLGPQTQGFLPLPSTNYFAITSLSFVFSVLINASFILIIIDAGYEDFFKKNIWYSSEDMV